MKLTEDELLLINRVKLMSSRFFKEMEGSFYPFAYVIKGDRQTTSVAAWDGEDSPEPQSLIDILEKSLPDRLIKKKIILAVICIDISVNNNVDGVDTKQDAIEMRFVSLTYRKNVYLNYELDSDNNVTFKDFWMGDVGSVN